MKLLILLPRCHEDIAQQNEEGDKDTDHLNHILLGLYPELMEEVETAQYLYRYPEHHHCGYGHADVGTPRRQPQLLAEDEDAAQQAGCCHDARHGMMVAQEVLVVAEHQQQIAGPEDHVQLHEGDDTGVAGHRTGCYHVLA